MRFRSLMMCGAGAGLAILTTPAIAAAQASSAAQPSELEELIVTAQRREENSQKVPISMTVIGAEEVAQHLRSGTDLSQMVPNIQLDSFVGFGIPRTGIRGISQSDFNANATTSNMVYIDDLPLDAPVSQGVPFWDLGRVEVLRGPQGTLFGRNATGGAIRYIVATPTPDFEGYGEVSVGDHKMREVRAAISGPITSTLEGRLSFISHDYGGDINNVFLHQTQGKKEFEGVRAVLAWTPTENLKVVLRAQHFRGDQDVMAWKATPGVTTSPDNFGPLANGWTSVAQIQSAYGFKNLGQKTNYTVSENGVDPNEHIEHTPVSLNVDYDMGGATLTSVTGYLRVKQSYLLDNDASPVAFLDEYDKHFAQQYSQEFRLTSNGDGPFKWIAGAFYMKELVKVNMNFDATFWRGNEADLLPNARTVLYTRGTRNDLETYAAFFHTSYQLTPELMLTAAARYTTEKKSVDYRFRTQWDFPTAVPRTPQEFTDFIKAVDTGVYGTRLAAASPASASAKKDFSEPTWKLGLDYQLNSHTLVYGQISRGFKGGAFPPTSNTLGGVQDPSGAILSVRPETVTDYEVGVKSDVIPGRLRVNGSVFYYDYRNFQTNQLIPALAVQILSNLPKAELYGAEIEIDAVPVDHLKISLGMGAVHTEITKSTDPALLGNKLPLAQDFNANLLVKYDFETSLGTITPEVSAKYTGNFYGTKENVVQMGGYTLINARIGFESADKRYYGAIWGTNLADLQRPVAIDDPGEFWGSNIAYLNEHRRYGLTIGARF